MPKQEYPMDLYDATGKSQTVRTPEKREELMAAGWAEDPDTAAGRPKPDADRPADTPWLGDIPAAVQTAPPKDEYPMWVYHATKKAVEVKNAAQHAALGDGWYESQPEADAPAAVSGEADNGTDEQRSTPPAVVPESVPLDISKMSVAEAELYVDTITTLEELGRVAEAEEKSKNRVGVKKAIEAKLEKLAAEPIVLTPPTP